ncbi:MAG: glycosyltransferase [Candidatus Moraniibacteriota bacterium]|nr:MAG: glycosyltransferase [Candidatus Moranbacteria bacterium]
METLVNSFVSISFFQEHLSLWWGYVPLGVIGVWRWSIWAFKKIIALFYRIPEGKYDATLAIVTPVYNEDPKMFQKALYSWKRNKPDEIIAVIDSTDNMCIKVFKKFSKGCPEATLIITKKYGKRAALVDGIKASKSEMIALVDSDTIWTRKFKSKVLGPFENPKVGGVAPRQDVFEPKTLARKLFRIHIFNRYGNDLIYQAAFGNALSCISGRTGIYRRSAIEHLTHELEQEKFLGKKCISGDDKRLTGLVQRDGWLVKYVENALVYTPGTSDMKTYTKQQVRWTRNSWRSDLKATFSRWLWRNPFLAFHILDRFVQPFTLLFGPIFFIIALYRGDWLVASIIFCWWMVSRAIKIFGHLKNYPKDIFILPLYVFYCFFLGMIKIYTLITVDEQGWITRWDKSRLKAFVFFRDTSAHIATLAILVGLFFVGFQMNSGSLSHLKEMQQKIFAAEERAEKRLWKTEDQSTLVDISKEEAQIFRDTLIEKIEADAFGYYRIQPGETLSDVRRRFFLEQETSLYTEEKIVLKPFERVFSGTRIAIPVKDLRTPNWNWYREKSRTRFVALAYPKENAIRISGKGSFVTIPELTNRLRNPSILENLGNGEFILRKNLFIDNGVTLLVEGEDVKWLKLRSGVNDFSWIKSEGGNIFIQGTKITSWDEENNNYDSNWEDGRSYILQKLSGRMDIIKSEVAYLGYFGSPQRGKPFGGPYGVSWKISDDSFRDELSTGVIDESSIHHNLFGLYTYGMTGGIFTRNDVSYNVEYGFDPHDDSNNLLIENNRATYNGNHGIITSKRCFSNIIRGNVSKYNRLHGIMLDRSSNNNLVEGNTLSGNINGVALYNSIDNVVVNNILTENGIGIRANRESRQNFFGENMITGSKKGIYAYQESFDNYAFENVLVNNKINIHIKDGSNLFLVKKDKVPFIRAKEEKIVGY